MFPARRPYSPRVFAGDCFGGIIAALIAIPYGLAMASLMGLPPILGIFTSILTAPVTALLGRNPVLIGGTASATVPFIALAVREQGIAGAAKICIAAALFLLLFSVLRLGRHIQKVPQAVVTGFSCGIGGLMVISQLDTILGVGSPWTRSAGAPLTLLFRVLGRVGDMQAAPLVLGVLVIAAAMLSARWSARLPAPLIGVVVAVLVANFFGLHEKQVGKLPLTMPAYAGFSWQRSDFTTLLPSALGLAFVSAVNILITSRVVEHFRGWHRHARKTDADRELARLRTGQYLRWLVRRSHERRNSGAQLGQRPLRRYHARIQYSARGVSDRLFGDGIQIRGPDSDPGAGRRHRLDGHLPARMEHLAPLAEDAPSGCSRFPRHRVCRTGDQCRRRGRRRMFAVCAP